MENREEKTGPRVLLVESDLFFAARLLSGREKMGCWVGRATTEAHALELASEIKPQLAILNLASARIDALETARRLKTEAEVPKVLAYYSHVKIPGIVDQATAAGIDLLVPNSAITLRLSSIVSSMLKSPES